MGAPEKRRRSVPEPRAEQPAPRLIPAVASWPFDHETELRACGAARVAGVDEAGRGPLAGPVVAAAVVFHDDDCPDGVCDSKLLTPAAREAAFARLIECTAWSVGLAGVDEIGRLNILRAAHLAMRRAVDGLAPAPDFLLVDGLAVPGLPAPCRFLVRGEAQSASIAAASIIAKVTRDRVMERMHARWPIYNFARHKGYATPEHLAALAAHGPCPIHRAGFAPVRAAAEAAARAGAPGHGEAR